MRITIVLFTMLFLASCADDHSSARRWVEVLPQRRAGSIAEAKGVVWIGTDWGLYKVMPNDTTVLTPDNSPLSDLGVSAIALDSKGVKWIGTRDGLWKFDDVTWEVFRPTNSGILSAGVGGIFIDPDGRKWITSLNGISILADTGWSTMTVSMPTRIAFDTYTAWIGTWGGGLVRRIHLQSNSYVVSNSDLKTNYVFDVFTDDRNRTWIGEGGGMHVIENDVWKNYNAKESPLPNSDVTRIVQDNEGAIWVGTYAGGLAKLTSDGEWDFYNTTNSPLPSDQILSMMVDKKGNIWVGTYRGVWMFKR